MRRVHLDFETRSRLSVKDVGAAKYAAHPSTTVLCLAFKIDNGPIVQLVRDDLLILDPYEETWAGPAGDLSDLALDENTIFVAHNALFEQMVWEHQMVHKHGFPPIPIRRWRCTAAKAAAYALPRDLSRAAKVLELAVQKDMEGNRVMQKLSRPRRVSKANPKEFWEPEDAPEDFKILYSYNIQDVEAEYELDHALPDLHPDEQEMWFLDQEINARGVQLDIAAIEKTLEFIAITVDKLKKEFVEITEGTVQTPSQVKKFLEWLEDEGVWLPNLQAATVDSYLEKATTTITIPSPHPYDLPKTKDLSKAIRALQIRRQLGKISTAKYTAMLERVCDDGRLRDLFMYHAASTGRWGGKGVQPQNLPRPKGDVWMMVRHLMDSDYDTFCFLYDNLMEVFSSNTRGMFISRPGYDLVAADFSAIEARVLAWLAGQDDVVETFRQGKDIYNQQATAIYGRPINRKDPTMENEGMIGKVAILALGYEGGIGAFGSMAKTYGLDLMPLADSILTLATQSEKEKAALAYNGYKGRVEDPLPKEAGMAADIVKQKWRAANDKITQYWHDIENAAIEAVQAEMMYRQHRKAGLTKEEILATGLKLTIECGKVKWYVRGNGAKRFLFCELPSGRRLAYHRPKISRGKTPWGTPKLQLTYMAEDLQTKQYWSQKAYGGLLVENITQAVARDLLRDALLRTNKAGYLTVLHIHDEEVAEVPEEFGSVIEFEELMAQLPPWAEGLPVKAEGWRGKRYKK